MKSADACRPLEFCIQFERTTEFPSQHDKQIIIDDEFICGHFTSSSIVLRVWRDASCEYQMACCTNISFYFLFYIALSAIRQGKVQISLLHYSVMSIRNRGVERGEKCSRCIDARKNARKINDFLPFAMQFLSRNRSSVFLVRTPSCIG